MQLEKYADVLIWGLSISRKNPLKSGEAVVVRFNADALELAEILYGKLVRKKLNPVIRLLPTPGMELDFYEHGSPGQISFVPAGEKELAENVGGASPINFPGDTPVIAPF
jgi:aminopeptidase